jgi:hypothetical protein
VPCIETGHAVNGVIQESDRCISYVLDNGVEVRVIWPFGYSAIFDPFVVYDNSGKEVARDGDALLVAGDGPLEGQSDDCGQDKYVILAEPVTRQHPGPGATNPTG